MPAQVARTRSVFAAARAGEEKNSPNDPNPGRPAERHRSRGPAVAAAAAAFQGASAPDPMDLVARCRPAL
eukprot:6431423-Pyramimonas_sp.AAC.1